MCELASAGIIAGPFMIGLGIGLLLGLFINA